MKNIYNLYAFIFIVVTSFSCQNESLEMPDSGNNSEGAFLGNEMPLSLDVVSPDPLLVNTRAVDPDGSVIRTMDFFCFDKNGKYIKIAQAVYTTLQDGNSQPKGEITVSVPANTRIMHIVCNLNRYTLNEDSFTDKTEAEVINGIESVSGLLVYWARIEVPSNVTQLYTNVSDAQNRSETEAVIDWITIETNPTNETHKGVSGKGNPIKLMRNQAKVTVESEGATDEKGWEGTDFVVTGFTVYNSQAYGTVAPYHAENGYPSFGKPYNVDNWSQETYITLPKNNDILDEIREVDDFSETYIFESPNSQTNPVDVIIKGYNIIEGENQPEQYYKAQIIDVNKGLLQIRRNHHYSLKIIGSLFNGSSTFDEALSAPAANNIWLTISDEVKSITDGSYRLMVNDYVVVRNTNQVKANNNLDIDFVIEKIKAEVPDVDPSLISLGWVDEDQEVGQINNFEFNNATSKGKINLTLNQVQSGSYDILEGVIVIKYRQLFRRIKVIVTPIFDFLPVYASSEGIQGKADLATLVYNIPENYPEELFPINVLISTKDLNVRPQIGQQFSIVTDSDNEYGSSFDLTIDGVRVKDNGYKYVMSVTSPGVKRIYFQTIEDQILNNYKTFVTLESSNFNIHHEPLTLSNVEYDSYLEVKGMKEYISGPESSKIKYMYVAPKKHAPIVFNLATMEAKLVEGELTSSSVSVTQNEEFLLYSSNLDHYADDDERLTDEYKSQFDCYFVPFNETTWNDDGRVFGFYPRKNIPSGEFKIYMETNTAKVNETIFIISNNTENKSIKPGAENNYIGKQFRSATFELVNHHPYHFNSAIKVGEKEWKKDESMTESETDIKLNYSETSLEVSFDITSYTTSDGTEVDPFGSAFEVYIDAPLYVLENDENNNNLKAKTVTMPNGENKVKLEQLDNGRIVYRVDASRTTEEGFGESERKKIKLKAEQIVTSSNKIKITTDSEQIAYFSEAYNISFNPLEFSLNYGGKPVPLGHTVTFYYKNSRERIYTATINQPGICELYLNNANLISWDTEPVIIHMQAGGVFYKAEFESLSSLLEQNEIIELTLD